VEASSSFSIFLSGFLVKSALFGFYKITYILNIELATLWCVVIAIIGCVDSSLKM
jgi:formate hydrogenlyase subunit 3/multisubunit Na+/H+ antiporter MnhD subunit